MAETPETEIDVEPISDETDLAMELLDGALTDDELAYIRAHIESHEADGVSECALALGMSRRLLDEVDRRAMWRDMATHFGFGGFDG